MRAKSKHTLIGALIFSLLAGAFGAALALALGTYMVLMEWAPSDAGAQLLGSVGVAFAVFFAVTFDWLFKWYFAERLGGRVGKWQSLPSFIRRWLGPTENDQDGTPQS